MELLRKSAGYDNEQSLLGVPVVNWSLLGEGNRHVVLCTKPHASKRVLRVAKRKYGGNEYSPERLSIDSTVWAPFHWHLDPGDPPMVEVDFGRHVLRDAFGDLLPAVELVDVDLSSVLRVLRLHEEKRQPRFRGDYEFYRRAVITDDLSSPPHSRVPNRGGPKPSLLQTPSTEGLRSSHSSGTGGGDSARELPAHQQGLANSSVVWDGDSERVAAAVTVEVKPKSGVLAPQALLHEGSGVKTKVPRYQMHQRLKMAQGRVGAVSGYDPRELLCQKEVEHGHDGERISLRCACPRGRLDQKSGMGGVDEAGEEGGTRKHWSGNKEWECNGRPVINSGIGSDKGSGRGSGRGGERRSERDSKSGSEKGSGRGRQRYSGTGAVELGGLDGVTDVHGSGGDGSRGGQDWGERTTRMWMGAEILGCERGPCSCSDDEGIARVAKSLRVMAASPQNNIKVAVDGVVVVGGERGTLEGVGRDTEGVTDQGTSGGLDRRRIEEALDCVAAILWAERILAQVRMCQELDVLDIEGASIALDELSARISRRDATGGAGRVDADGKNDAALHMRDGGTLQELRGITSRVGLSLRTSWNVAAESSRSAGTVPPNDTARERQSKATSAHPSSSSGRPSIHPFAPMDASHSLPTSAAEEPAGLLAARAGRVAAERVLRSLSDRDLSAVLAGFAVAMCARDLGIMITLWEASPRSIRDPGAPRQEGAPATKEGPAFGSQAAGVTAASEHMPCSQAAGVTVANDDHMPPEALAPSAPIEHGEVAIDVEDMDRGSMANEEGVPRKFLTIEQRGTRDGFRSQSREEGHRAPASSAAGPGVCTAPAVTVCQGCRRVWLSDGRSLEYKVGIVDADYKPIGRIRQWLLRDREIMQAYLASQSGTRDVA